MSDKATQLRQTVREEVQPLLDTTLDYVHVYSEASRKFVKLKIGKVEEKVYGETNSTNGSIATAEDMREGSSE
jgi:hypothetical protein